MRNIDEIIINRVVLCVLDKENNQVLLPDAEVELNEDNYEYFEKQVLRLFKDEEAWAAKFDGEGNILKALSNEIFEDQDNLLINGRKAAQFLYRCMSNEDKEASGVLAICLVESQQGRFISMMKLNYVNSYSQYIKQEDNGISIAIGISKTGLPGLGQKPSRSVIIKEAKDNQDNELLVIDRQREGYFANAFVKCKHERDRLESTRIFHKASENFARRAFKDNAQEAERFRSNVTERMKSEESIDIERMVEAAVEDAAVRNEYKAVLISEGLTESHVEIDRDWTEKKLKKKRLKVDKSIELYIDSEVYHDKEKFQIKRNGDGTIDIILRNIKNYIEK